MGCVTGLRGLSVLVLTSGPARGHSEGMRKATYFAMSETEALALVDRAATMHLASTGDEGQPILRALHVVHIDGALYFHAAPVGEKTEALGKAAVLSYEEDVARVPSTFLDPERACPATTLYRAVQIEGVLEACHDPHEKTRVLAALMAKLQPEGGYVPLDPTSPLYEKAIAGIAVVKLVVSRITGKKKLGQNRTPGERQKLVEGFFGRGHAGDYAAAEAVIAANPKDSLPSRLLAKDGTRLLAHLEERHLDEAARLLEGAYWLEGMTRERVKEAFRRSVVTVGAIDHEGKLLAAARATSDGRVAWIFDVIVAPEARGRGLAKGMIELLLGHPAVGDAMVVRLGTRDADELYRRYGFEDVKLAPLRAYRVVEMARRRHAPT